MVMRNIGWKIKVFTPNGQFDHWYVTSIKKNGTGFSGVNNEEGAKIYTSKIRFQPLLDHIEKESGKYELIEILGE
jgi:hypothetical protein